MTMKSVDIIKMDYQFSISEVCRSNIIFKIEMVHFFYGNPINKL